MIHRFFLLSILLVLAAPTAAWSQQTHTVRESEPNDTPASANPAALGDSLVGTISSVDDVDFFSLDIPAGMFVRPRRGFEMCFFDQDGITLLQCNSEDWPLRFLFTTAGRYYLRLRAGPPHMDEIPMGAYRAGVEVRSFALDVGDPVRRFVDLGAVDRGPFGDGLGMAAGLNGELYVASWNRVLRIDPNGDTATIASGAYFTGSIAVDGFGDVVVARADFCGSTANLIWKISPSGTLSPFPVDVDFDLCGYSWPLAVGSDGDLWVGRGTAISRLDPTGRKKAEIPLQGAYRLAVGPFGEVYASSGAGQCYYGISVVRGSNVECVIPWIESSTPSYEIAIDSDRGVYVGDWAGGTDLIDTVGNVNVFPAGSTTPHPHAHVPHVSALTFARDIQGNMTSRLFAIQVFSPGSRIVELNGATERPIGAGLNVRFFHATLDPLAPATLGAAYRQTLHVTTDATSLTWSIANGSLPRGLTLSAGGVLHGTPSDTGSFTFIVRATSGVRSWFAPGALRVGSIALSAEQVSDALLGGPALSPELVAYLDLHGNRNGILDVGDLRAYLRAQSRLP